jgi:hypothetical protein
MNGLANRFLTVGLLAGVVAVGGFSTGCVHHHHYDQVDYVDVRGYHHQGYYDDNHQWRGGYYDEQHSFHNDPGDWHH